MYMVFINRNIKILRKWHGYTGTCNYIGGRRITYFKIKSEFRYPFNQFIPCHFIESLYFSQSGDSVRKRVSFILDAYSLKEIRHRTPAHPFSTPIQQPTLGIQALGK
jgi:hypothetical protein